MFIALIVFLFSMISIFSPRTSWYLSTGWRFKDAEPSDLALSLNRFIGVVTAIISIIIIISSISDSISVNNWPDSFIERLESDDVESVAISVGIDEDIQLDPTEAKTIASIIRNVHMNKTSRKSMRGYSESIVINFKTHYKVTIYSIGDSFTIELVGSDIEYNFHSEELEKWVSNNLEE